MTMVLAPEKKPVLKKERVPGDKTAPGDADHDETTEPAAATEAVATTEPTVEPVAATEADGADTPASEPTPAAPAATENTDV